MTTNWTLVLQAKDDNSPEATAALSQLCQAYWKPINVVICHWGYPVESADDLTQQFFAHFLEKESFRRADRDRGRFRTFLLTSVKHFLANEWHRATAQKRGGGTATLSLDALIDQAGEPLVDLADERTTERIYNERWALTLLAHVRARLQADYQAMGKADRFMVLEEFLPGAEGTMSYAEAAAKLRVSEGNLKSEVHRLRRRYRERLREEIAQTVTTASEVDEEIRFLISVVKS